MIREPRLPFYPTGCHSLNGRSTRKGEKGTSWPRRVDLELGTLPSGIAPFRSRGRPDPCTPPHTDCLNASTAFLGPQKPTFHSPTWELGGSGSVFLWISTTREKDCPRKLRTKIHTSLGTGSLLLPPPGSVLSPQGIFPAWALPESHSPLLSPKSLCSHSDSIQWEELRHVATRWLRLRHDSRWNGKKSPTFKQLA